MNNFENNEETLKNLRKRAIILGFLHGVERTLEMSRRWVIHRYLSEFTDYTTYNITTRSYEQNGKKKYTVTLTLNVTFDEEDILRMYEDIQNAEEYIKEQVREKVEEERERAKEYLEKRKEKLKKLKS
jgi:molecular chaperone DnaK (HSP70)